ncbi:unnamed protein product [Phytophthora lilii]|uniref:Unnamed protein product n=1 Tax=Phytophthora lilii TaxID=2077276 RepID=A0A9W6TB87_9STRA|nr:unnamed protein product [Phytophthora lilii]
MDILLPLTNALICSSLIGVSPEFEMALYTLCFLNGQENNHVQLGPYLCNIKCFSFGHGKDTKIGTAFPEALPLTEAQAATKIQAILRGRHARVQNPHARRQAPPPPPGAAWGPPPGGAATPAPQAAQPTGNAWAKPLTKPAAPPAPSAAAPAGPKPTGAWAQPHKCGAVSKAVRKQPRLDVIKAAAMEAKGDDDRTHTMHKPASKTLADEADIAADESGAPTPEVVALRHGYNQTYIVRSSKTNLHEVLFRCGNWCYSGKVDLGSADIELADLPVVVPALQKQQASLQYLCEWKAMPSTSQYSTPLETLYDVYDFLGAELSSERIERKLMKAAEEHTWVDGDDDSSSRTFFELQSGGYDCFDGVDIVASKTFVRGLVLLVIYYQRSFYVVLQAADGEQPLLDVRFPDLSAHLQGIHLQTYRDDDCSNMKKLTLWQAANIGKHQSPPKPLKVQCKDVSGTGYNQTFLIRRTPRTEGSTNTPSLREVLFRFGNWCYNGHVDLGPKLELSDIPIIIPMLRRQQSALMPATSLFTPSMEHLAEIVPAMQEEMSKAEQFVQTLAQTGGSFVNSSGNVGSWLEDDNAECFFEIAMNNKIHVGGVVLVMLYYDYTFYVYLENGEEEQPLLDTNFPDVSLQKEGIQLKTYRNGVRGCEELRRISLWKVENEFADEDEEEDAAAVDCITSRNKCQFRADSKEENRREEDVKSSTSFADGDAKVSKEMQSRKSALPHHVAPLKRPSGAATNLKGMPDLGMKAPWDDTGKPLGMRTSK